MSDDDGIVLSLLQLYSAYAELLPMYYSNRPLVYSHTHTYMHMAHFLESSVVEKFFCLVIFRLNSASHRDM